MRPAAIWLVLVAGHSALGQIPLTPPNPEFFSAMSLIWTAAPDAPQPRATGPVEEILWQELRLSVGNPDLAPGKSIQVKYDRDGNETGRTETDPAGIGSRSSRIYSDGRVQSSTFERLRAGKSNGPPLWEKWTYDPDGRLQDFQRGQGDELQNHYLNFRYDSNGRVTSAEYRQGAKDAPFGRTFVKYIGNAVETRQSAAAGEERLHNTKRLDTAGRVVDLRTYTTDSKTKAVKQWFHVAFRYDAKGRIIEQVTDPYQLGAGDDSSPLPGRVITTYDDAKGTREQSYREGESEFRSASGLDRDGLPVSMLVFMNGVERPSFEIFPAKSDTEFPERRAGRVVWDVVYDDRGNWTERRRMFTPAAGGPPVVTRIVKQQIRYRSQP
jgi:hypothetical protein